MHYISLRSHAKVKYSGIRYQDICLLNCTTCRASLIKGFKEDCAVCRQEQRRVSNATQAG